MDRWLSMNRCFIKTPLGIYELADDNQAIILCQYRPKLNDKHVKPPQTSLLKKTVKEIDAYFKGRLKKFTIPLSPTGTDFQKTVWQALETIPYGQTWSYQDLAKKIDNEKASRAVGNANGKNPIGLIIPCHRVIQKSGKLGGYTGGVHIKEQLLALENKYQKSF